MKTKIEKLENAIKNNRGNVKTSLTELLYKGFSYTGKSGYSKGWANKSVWTTDVMWILTNLKIKFNAGNNAPRGGANGEFVELTDNVLLKQISQRNKELKEIAENAKQKAIDEKKKAYEAAERYIATLGDNQAFEAKWNSLELKEASNLSWSMYRESLKTTYPNEWLILKEKFRAKQNIL